MKPKHIILTISFLIGFIVSSCSDDTVKPYIPEPVGDGYSLLNLSIKNNQQTPTYAPGTFEAYPQEKEVRSVAFFTKTDDVGQYGQPGFLAGAFNRFFSTEELRSAYGLYEPLEQAGTGYTVSIRVKSDGFGPKTQLIVIANYEENGLTETLKSVSNWDELTTVLTPKIKDEHLKTPLLMYGANSNVALTNGGTEAVVLSLYRIVARMDVVNEAADDTNPDDGFVLESAQLLHSKEFGFLLPNNKQSILIPTVASLPIVKAGNLPESDPAKITGLYLYETDNKGEESAKTSVLLKGRLFGTPFEREIPLKKPDEPGKDGDPIALQRNHRYQLTITNVVGEDINWTIQIADWSSGEDIDVKPVLEKPVLTGFSFENRSPGSLWDEPTLTYTYDGKNAEVIRFTATTSTHTTTYAFECELDGKGESIGLNNPMLPAYHNLFTQGKPRTTYAAISQDYEITLPTVVNPTDYAVPVDIKLYIRNAGNRYYADTITVRCRPDYPGTQHQPVLFAGIYWAPVNVGAKEIDNATPTIETRGHFYQWGRNEPITYIYDYSTKTVTGPISYEDAVEKYKGWFIASSIDWLKSNDPNMAERNARWSKDMNDSPCPKGWRLPNKAEADPLKQREGSFVHEPANKRLRAPGDENGKMLYFPLTDYRYYSNTTGMGGYPNLLSMIHTSTMPTATTFARWAFYYSNGWVCNQTNEPLATACSIRCIQNITTPDP